MASKDPVRVAVTGAAGQIGYSLVFRIASGSMLGPDQPLILHLLEITPALDALRVIAMNNADGIAPERFTAMTRLDHNRAVAQLAAKTGAKVTEVSKMTIWGNHSATQYPDIFHAEVGGKSAADLIDDQRWLEKDFIP